MNLSQRTGAVALALLLGACGADDAPTAAPADVAATPAVAATPPPTDAAPAPAPTPVADAAAPLSVADLDAYAAGMTREVEVLRGHADKLKQAHAAQDQAGEMAALLALGGVEVRDAGAAAAAIDVTRYARIKEQVDALLAADEMSAALQAQVATAEQVDVSAFDAAQRQQHADHIAQLRALIDAPRQAPPADVAAALAVRRAELAHLRAESIALRIGGATN